MGNYSYKLPDIGEGVVEAEITAWHVSVGDRVSEEDPIADAMTDKATIELTSPVDGVIVKVACEEGDMLAVGADLAIIEVEGDVQEQAEPTPASEVEKAHAAPIPNTNPANDVKPVTALSGGKVLASPAVRRRAREDGLALTSAKATGTQGQITHVDLDRLETALAPLPGETRKKVIGLRRVIAERMQASKRHIPHFTYVDEIDMTELEGLRKRANEMSGETRGKLTVLPFIIRALAMTLREWPQFNARYNDEQGFISEFEDLHLGMAAQTDKGLIVPVIKSAQSLSIWELGVEIARLAEGARESTLGTEDLTGATTTLTSLGPLGGIVTTPVINRPEVAIFGPNKIRQKLVMEEGVISERRVMNFSVSCDHRVIDGYDAAKMVGDLRARLEDPIMMFLES
ncbi:MAG: dihydrolipoamide acetyltransferase family protein [Maricaulaceae bacterium]